MKRWIYILFAVAPLHLTSAQQDLIEYQARLLAHVQNVPEGKTLGVAGWVILPNVMRTTPFRTYTLAGIIARSNERWVELMGGLRLNSDGTRETALDIRVLEQSLKWLDIFAEVEYSFTTRQWYLSPILTTTLASKNFGIKAGVEFDLFLHPQRTTFFYGPRVSLHFPVSESVVKNVMFATAYRLQENGEPVLRQYLLVNF